MAHSHTEHRPGHALRAHLSGEWRRALFYGGVGLSFALLALAPTLTHMVSVWLSTDAYNYALLVVPMLVYLLGWHHRDALLQLNPQPSYAGLVIVAAATLLWIVAAVVHIRLGMHIGLVLVLQGICYTTLGRVAYWRLFPLLALLFFMIPAGDLLQPILRDAALKSIEYFALVAGLPHHIDGYTIYISDLRYVVVDACSGLVYVTLGAFLGYGLGALQGRPLGISLLMTISGAVLGVICNAVRINAIIWLDWVNGTQMELAAHREFHYGVTLLLIGLLVLVSRPDRSNVVADGLHVAVNQSLSRHRDSFLAPLAAGLLVLLTVGPIELYSLRLSDAGAQNQQPIKLQLQADEVHAVNIQRSTGIEGTLRVPTWQLTGDKTWREAKRGRKTACAQSRCFELIHTRWTQQRNDSVRHIHFAYFLGDYITASKLLFRLHKGWSQLLGEHRAAGLIAIYSVGESPSADFLAQRYLQTLSTL